MKVFGKELFGYKREPQVLYDFAQHGLVNPHRGYAELTVAVQADSEGKKKVGRPKKVRTPKEVYNLKALNDNKFSIEVDHDYLDQQIKTLEKKLSLLPKPRKRKKRDYRDGIPTEQRRGGAIFGRLELMSMIERLKNRKKLAGVKRVMGRFPHTTSALINDVLKANENLSCANADEFVPDFPEEAVEAIEAYNDMCVKVCGKKTTLYVIADRSDFEKKDKRRDPILLAQSPFGFFWQILGAWDDEMIFLGDL